MLGLTTAASSWAAAAIGILAGAGDYLAAGLATIMVLLILEANRLPFLRRLDERMERGGREPER